MMVAASTATPGRAAANGSKAAIEPGHRTARRKQPGRERTLDPIPLPLPERARSSRSATNIGSAATRCERAGTAHASGGLITFAVPPAAAARIALVNSQLYLALEPTGLHGDVNGSRRLPEPLQDGSAHAGHDHNYDHHRPRGPGFE